MALSDKQRKYVSILALSNNIGADCKEHGLSRSNHYLWVNDEEYRQAIEDKKIAILEEKERQADLKAMEIIEVAYDRFLSAVKLKKTSIADVTKIVKAISENKYMKSLEIDKKAKEIINKANKKKKKGGSNVTAFKRAK